MSCTSVHPSLTKLNNEKNSLNEKVNHLEKEKTILTERHDEHKKRIEELNAKCSAAEAALKRAEEELGVQHAERKLVDEMLLRADAAAAELRRERENMLKRNGDLHSECKMRQHAQLEQEQERARMETALSVSQMELKLMTEKSHRQAEELETSASRESELSAKVSALVVSMEAMRVESSKLQESLSVAQAERKLLDESILQSAAGSQSDTKNLKERLAAAEARAEEANAAKLKGDEERMQLQVQLQVANAEKRILQDVTSRLQQACDDERQNAQAARDRADAQCETLLARLEVADTAARTAGERLGALEAEKRQLGDKYIQSVSQAKAMQAEHRVREEELRGLRLHHQSLALMKPWAARASATVDVGGADYAPSLTGRSSPGLGIAVSSPPGVVDELASVSAVGEYGSSPHAGAKFVGSWSAELQERGGAVGLS